MTQTYLHELFHAWLHQYRPQTYDRFESCTAAERFADATFRALGGHIKPARLCGSYSIQLSRAPVRDQAF
ncbi:MAG TPA: hypothetical protein VGK94_14595, partial [Candidatus Polarisedimenticolia bacterium]